MATKTLPTAKPACRDSGMSSRQTKYPGLRRDRRHRCRQQNLGRSRSRLEPLRGPHLNTRRQIRGSIRSYASYLDAYTEGGPGPELLVEMASGSD